MIRLAIRLGLACGLATAVGAQGPGEQELQELRDAIDARRERVVEFEREQRALLEVLEEIDRKARALSQQVARARGEVIEARDALVRHEARAAELEPRLERTRRAMAARVVALYKTGELGPVQVLFAADGLAELVTRVEWLRRLLEHDRRLLERYRNEAASLERARLRAREAAARHERAREEVRARARELELERSVKRAVLARVRDSRTRERGALVELEGAARTLEETLSRIGDAGSGGSIAPERPFASRRGSLRPPVAAPVARPFGRAVDAEFRTQVFRKGVDFEADSGAPVVAVAPGSVRFADWFRGYGRVVILDHGERYFTVSGHLDEIHVRVGDTVQEGDVIGTVGDTGSLSGPRLYFEIRRGGRALDPADWLAGREPG